MLIRQICGLFIFSIFLSVSASNDWARWRGPAYDGAATVTLPENPGLSLAWSIALGSGYSSVSVAEGIAVAAYSDGKQDVVSAFKPEDGAMLWTFKIGDTYKGHDGSHDGTIATPAIAAGKVYATSAWGHIFALDLKTGKALWRRHLVDDFGATAPSYGFGSSPLVFEDLLILHIGAEKDSAIAALSVSDGSKRWGFGNGKIEYQSPELGFFHGEPHLLADLEGTLYGLNPKTGVPLWSLKHGGDRGALDPLPLDGNRLFFNPNYDEGWMIRIDKDGEGYKTTELWRSNEIKGANAPPVYHKGFVFGYNGRILVAINAEDGKRAWRSRPPGAGFMIRVGDYLAIQNINDGTLHLVNATGDAYHEQAMVKVFDHYSYSPPSFAGGKVFLRSPEQLAAVEIARAVAVTSHEVRPGYLPESRFGEFVARVEAAPVGERKAMVDAWLQTAPQSPIFEANNQVHLIYHGQADDLAISGDFLERRQEVGLNRVAGTDLYYYSFKLDHGGLMSYALILNYGKPMPDPRNPHQSTDGRRSLIAASDWAQPDWLTPLSQGGGSLSDLKFKSTSSPEVIRDLSVYLPPNYADNDQRYPVIYFQGGQGLSREMAIPTMLDNLISSKRMKPVIGIFLGEDPEGSWRDNYGATRDAYIRLMAEELVPFVDETWRTLAEPGQRLVFGVNDAAETGVRIVLQRPEVFGSVAGQSTYLSNEALAELAEIMVQSKSRSQRLYLDWGLYENIDSRGGFDLAVNSRQFVSSLREAGFRVADNETPTGTGGPAWQARFARLVAEFFAYPAD